MKKILILSSIWGHESIAKGVYDALKGSGFDTRLEIIKIDPITETYYKIIYRFLPKSFQTGFKLTKYKFFENLLNKYFEERYFETLERVMTENRPQIVICSYFEFITSIEKLQKKFKYRLLNVVADPWTFAKMSTSKKGLNLLFDKRSMAKIRKFGASIKAKETGWFVEEKFRTELSQQSARKKLGIDPETLTICVTGGSEGMYNVLKIVNSFVRAKRNVQILFMCGENKQLYDLVKSFSRLLSKKSKIKIFPHKFTSHMEIFLRASDLVVGKAGPNTIFESVACGVPFFAVSHISGQEDGNLELIRKYNIGYAEENPNKIAKILKSIIENPAILKKFQKPIQDLARYNQGARTKLLKLLA